MDMFDFAGMLFGRAGTSQQHSVTASGAASSEDGVASITMDADVTPAEDTGVEGDADQTIIDLPTSPDVDEGDELIVTLVGDGPLKTPVVTANPGSGDRMRTLANSAKAVADAAQAVAEAVNQHFFADTNGIHVTEATQEDWDANHSGANVLINSIGQLFRNGLNNLLAILPSGIAIYDGEGNDSSNIIARLLGTGAQIGRDADIHVSIDGNSFDVLKGTNNRQLITMRDSGDAGYVGATYFDEDGHEHHGAGAIVEADTDGSRMTVEINAEYNYSDIDINNFNGRTDMNINRMDSIRFSDPYDSSLTTYLQLGNPTRYQSSGSYAITTAGIDTCTNGPRITIPAGSYMFVGAWTFNSASASGDRNMQVGFRSGASGTLWGERVRIRQSSGNFAVLNVSALRTFSAETTVYLAGSASITSGAGDAWITAVRLN